MLRLVQSLRESAERSVRPGWAGTSVTKLYAGVLVFAVVAAFIPSAQAADLDVIRPTYSTPSAPPPPSKRLLCYAGLFGEGIVSHPSLDNVPVAGAYSEYYALGGRGGGLIGCDVVFQSGWFLGLEGTAAYGQLKGRHAGVPGVPFDFEGNAPFEMAAHVRFGFYLDPDVNVFISGGPSDTYFTSIDFAGVTTKGFNTGGQISTGFEWRVWSAFKVRAQYVYTWPGSDSTLITGVPLARINPTSHAFRLAFLRVFGL